MKYEWVGSGMVARAISLRTLYSTRTGTQSIVVVVLLLLACFIFNKFVSFVKLGHTCVIALNLKVSEIFYTVLVPASLASLTRKSRLNGCWFLYVYIQCTVSPYWLPFIHVQGV